MTVWKRNVGDTNDSIIVQLNGVEDLEAMLTVVGVAWLDDFLVADPPEPFIEFTGTIIDSPNRLVQINLGAWLTDAPVAKYRYRTRGTFAGGITKSWPEGWPDTLEINY
jgi:hypothetical protein